jgi:hypothetical protein
MHPQMVWEDWQSMHDKQNSHPLENILHGLNPSIFSYISSVKWHRYIILWHEFLQSGRGFPWLQLSIDPARWDPFPVVVALMPDAKGNDSCRCQHLADIKMLLLLEHSMWHCSSHQLLEFQAMLIDLYILKPCVTMYRLHPLSQHWFSCTISLFYELLISSHI